MLDDLLRGAFRLAHRRLGVVFLDLVWKAIWFVLTATALLLVAAWFGSRFRSVGWLDTANNTVNTAVAFALLREFSAVHRAQIFGALAVVLFLSLVIWFVFEAAFRAKILPLPLGEGGAKRRVRVSRFGETCDPHPARQPAGCRADLSQGERFGTFLVASVLKCLFLTNAGPSSLRTLDLPSEPFVSRAMLSVRLRNGVKCGRTREAQRLLSSLR